MTLVKAFHVLFVFVWLGNLLALTRLLGYTAKEGREAVVQAATGWFARMYYFVGLPSMILALVLGLILLTNLDLSYKPGWFHAKLTFVGLLVFCDILCGQQLSALRQGQKPTKPLKYKILHGLVGLCLLGLLFSVYLMRDREGEWLHQQQKPAVSVRAMEG